MFSLRNQTRTNLLLGLVRLHINNRDDAGTYHRLLREHDEANEGRGSRQRVNRDTQNPAGAAQPSLR